MPLRWELSRCDSSSRRRAGDSLRDPTVRSIHSAPHVRRGLVAARQFPPLFAIDERFCPKWNRDDRGPAGLHAIRVAAQEKSGWRDRWRFAASLDWPAPSLDVL